jgi:hypothetical protein
MCLPLLGLATHEICNCPKLDTLLLALVQRLSILRLVLLSSRFAYFETAVIVVPADPADPAAAVLLVAAGTERMTHLCLAVDH